MKAVIALILVSVSVALAQQYTSKYDNVDIDQILRSDRLLKNYVNCLLEKGKCSPEGTELKKNLPDALRTACSKCNDKQKAASKKIINYLLENKKDWFNSLEAKYDPDGTYRKKYESEAKKQGVKL